MDVLSKYDFLKDFPEYDSCIKQADFSQFYIVKEEAREQSKLMIVLQFADNYFELIVDSEGKISLVGKVDNDKHELLKYKLKNRSFYGLLDVKWFGFQIYKNHQILPLQKMFGCKAFKELNIYDRPFLLVMRKTGLFIATVIDGRFPDAIINESGEEISPAPILDFKEVQIVFFQLTESENENYQQQDQHEDLINKDFPQSVQNQTFYPNKDTEIANHFACDKLTFINFEIVNKKLNVIISQKSNQEGDINVQMITFNKTFIRKVIQKLNTIKPLEKQN
eukprot:403357728